MPLIRVSYPVRQALAHLPGQSFDASLRLILSLPARPLRIKGQRRSRGDNAGKYRVLRALAIGQSVTVPWYETEEGLIIRDRDHQKPLQQAVHRARKATGHSLHTQARPGGLQVTRTA